MELLKDKSEAELKQMIRNAFAPFEGERANTRGTCNEKDVPTIVRSLGLNPTPDAIDAIMDELRRDEESSGQVPYGRLEAVLLKQIQSNPESMLRRDPEEVIVRAFRAFDAESNGYIDAEQMKNLIMAKGDTLRPEEAKDFIAAASDDKGRIHYEDFAALLARDGRD